MNKYWKEKFYEQVAIRLNQLIRENGLTPFEFSKKAEYEFTSVKRILNGQPFQFHAMIGFASALNMTVDEIIAPINEMKIRYNIMEEVTHAKEESIQIQNLI